MLVVYKVVIDTVESGYDAVFDYGLYFYFSVVCDAVVAIAVYSEVFHAYIIAYFIVNCNTLCNILSILYIYRTSVNGVVVYITMYIALHIVFGTIQ